MIQRCSAMMVVLIATHLLVSAVAENVFHFSSYKKNWFQANEYCHQRGMRLAIIDSPLKHEMVVREAKATQSHPQAYFGGWLGASDLGLAGTYIWHGTGNKVAYAKWKPGEPSGGDEHCVVLHYWQDMGFMWTWNDGHCVTELTAICEPIENVSCIEQFK
ncbi:low affinity immunoglobulin epsilon Fc receptor-like [Aedes albopictus]|uniref:C-type lectin domain-containing protein n=1 Tax=Aedes albopictus TaxID=7160 RepID=A0ABM1YYU1_AEDAL|nr:low affinity immunoglobulin epsilon Fc receptor-like [Aedes albopictus]